MNKNNDKQVGLIVTGYEIFEYEENPEISQ